MTINCKSPITYYGGKKNMLNEILPLIPEHKLYCEPFFGGGAVYFAKQPSQIEVINDINDFVINFYRVLKLRFDELKLEVDASLSSRSIHRKAHYIFKNPDMYCELKKAWACWYLLNSSFNSKFSSGWKYDSVENKDCQVLRNRKINFNYDLVKRIELTQIESYDAIKVILSRDSVNTFFYIDPPYIDTDQGHYKGYTREMFINLLQVLSKIKGRFMLSCFASDIQKEFSDLYGWKILSYTKVNYALINTRAGNRQKNNKVELLVMNYSLETKQLSAF